MNEMAKIITECRKKKGFKTPFSLKREDQREDMLGKLMLVVTEIAEAAEAVRKNDPTNFEEELADTFIRLLDICGAMNIDIETAIEKKMKINIKRPERHGTTISL